MYLARAEAARLGWTSEVSATMYANGITAEMNRWGITDAAAIAAYLAQPSVALGTGNAQKISEQIWLSHFPERKSRMGRMAQNRLPCFSSGSWFR